MKKVYIKPNTEVIGIEAEQVLAVSMGLNDERVNSSDEGVQLSNKKEGMWGENQWGGSPWE
jgi:hypothetical protein